MLLVRVRRFCCGNPGCPRQTFAEPLGVAAARSAHRAARGNLVRAGELAIASADLLRKRRPDIDTADSVLAAWMETACGTLLDGFARGLERDRKAVAAAIATP